MAPRRQPTLQLDEAHRIVDAPVERYASSVNSSSVGVPAANAAATNGQNGHHEQSGQQGQVSAASTQATEQQLASIRKLSEHLGKGEPEEIARMSYLDAKKLIQQLTAEYREQRQKAS